MEAGRHFGGIDLLHQRLEEDLVDKRGLARAGHTGYGYEAAQGHLHVDVPKIVLPGPPDHQSRAVDPSPLIRHRDTPNPAQVLAGQRITASLQAGHRTRKDDVATMLAGPGANIDDMVSRPDRLLVVLYDDDRIPEVTEP